MEGLQLLCRRWGVGAVEWGKVAGLGTVFRWLGMKRSFFTCLRNSSERYSKCRAYLASFPSCYLKFPTA